MLESFLSLPFRLYLQPGPKDAHLSLGSPQMTSQLRTGNQPVKASKQKIPMASTNEWVLSAAPRSKS